MSLGWEADCFPQQQYGELKNSRGTPLLATLHASPTPITYILGPGEQIVLVGEFQPSLWTLEWVVFGTWGELYGYLTA